MQSFCWRTSGILLLRFYGSVLGCQETAWSAISADCSTSLRIHVRLGFVFTRSWKGEAKWGNVAPCVQIVSAKLTVQC